MLGTYAFSVPLYPTLGDAQYLAAGKYVYLVLFNALREIALSSQGKKSHVARIVLFFV